MNQRKTSLRRSFSAAVAVLTATGFAAYGTVARADIRYTSQMTMHKAANDSSDSNSKKSEFEMRTLNMFKDGKIRTESTMGAGAFSMQSVTITDCAAKQVYDVLPSMKVYTRLPFNGSKPAFLSSVGAMSGGGRPGRPPMQKPQQQPGVGKEVITYSLEELAPEKILDLDTKHYMITMHTESSGCPGNNSSTIKIEEWVANVQAGISCPPDKGSGTGSPSAPAQDDNPCKVTTEIHGDMASVWPIFGKLPVRTKIYMDEKKPDDYILTELREYSTAALDADPFSVPADYKELSNDEFAKAKHQDMMQQIMGGRTMPQMPDNAGQQQQVPPPPPANGNGNGDDNGDNPQQPQTKKHVYPMLPGGIKLPF
jgi:hypothetical protein